MKISFNIRSMCSALLIFPFALMSCGSGNEEKVSSPETEVQKEKATAEIEPKEKNHESFDEFWTDFREAVLNEDMSSVLGMTHFPFETRGPMDSDPVVKYDKNDFPMVFQIFLYGDTGLTMDMSESQAEFIKKTKKLSSKETIDENYTRIADMVFKKKAGYWKLTFVYLSNESIDKINTHLKK